MTKGKFHHLTYEERCQMAALLEAGHSISSIARQLGRSKSTISQEVSRNSGPGGYQHEEAQSQAEERRRQASAVPWKLTDDLWQLICAKLKLQWSPEQIAGWLRRQGLGNISFSRIYQRIREDRKAGGQLYLNLRGQGRKRKVKPKPGEAGRGQIPGRVDISERLAVVEDKSRVGDFEIDTIIGARHKGVLVSIVDRHSKFLFLKEVTNKTAKLVGDALISLLEPVKDSVHTLTADNGKEFACHQRVAAELDAQVYFARPYHSWERGNNEHHNGLVRQYLPKGMSFLGLDSEEVRRVADLINDRPRKVLGFATPREVFEAALPSAAAL